MISTTLRRQLHKGALEYIYIDLQFLAMKYLITSAPMLHTVPDSAVGRALAQCWCSRRAFEVLDSNPARSNIFTGNDVFYRPNIIIFCDQQVNFSQNRYLTCLVSKILSLAAIFFLRRGLPYW